MTAIILSDLKRRLFTEGLLDEPTIDDGFVSGRARFEAAGNDVTVHVDPDFDDADDDDFDVSGLVEMVSRVLAFPEARWRTVLDRIAEEIEDAVGDPDAIAEKTDLRLDLEVHSITVLPDAALLSFVAPRQFPESWIRAQLDDELEIEDVFVDERLEGTPS
ncbi:cytochrome C5 [Microbacterium sp. A84]|uniref:cytochrome C5 n=1 Tax=Microbacterium sp. A84 TaxID=3450715 RepID=UPI003F4253A0